jgi:hypothetical protein
MREQMIVILKFFDFLKFGYDFAEIFANIVDSALCCTTRSLTSALRHSADYGVGTLFYTA